MYSSKLFHTDPPQDGVSLSGYVNNTAVESGETLNLTCQVREGNPPPTLTWSSRCGQKNTVSGNDGHGPKFTSCKSSYIFVENVTAELSCTTWAKPEPTISWSRGGQPNDLSVTNHRYTSVVRFGKINRTDSGAYIVTASNNVKRVERTVNVSVYYPPDVSVVLVSGENVTEGNPLQLECRAEAVPQNYIYSAWSRTIGGRPVPLIISSPGKSLSISEVTFRDQGIYRCGATNGIGSAKRGQLGVRVRARPQFPSQIKQQAAALGENIKLMFKFVSYPAYVSLTWYKLSSNMANTISERLVVPNTPGSKFQSHVMEAEHEFLFYDTKVLLSGHVAELEISDVKHDDFGEYKFVAENDVGSSETIISFNLIDRPCPPTLTTILCENRVANVTWISCFNGGSSQIFKLQYKKKGGNWVIYDDITDLGENMTVSKVVESLDDGAQYSFRVYGQNRWNKSDTVETSCIVTGTTRDLAGPVAGGISAAIVVLGVALLVVFMFRRRKQGVRSSGETDYRVFVKRT
ncbi:hemicentin-2-like, partial [Liolophura sinensis]|uniref:hemicentin-2-like n=1 Tax=Liolophura sinensis TaxID=3198878 RepID=UPI00315883C8